MLLYGTRLSYGLSGLRIDNRDGERTFVLKLEGLLSPRPERMRTGW